MKHKYTLYGTPINFVVLYIDVDSRQHMTHYIRPKARHVCVEVRNGPTRRHDDETNELSRFIIPNARTLRLSPEVSGVLRFGVARKEKREPRIFRSEV